MRCGSWFFNSYLCQEGLLLNFGLMTLADVLFVHRENRQKIKSYFEYIFLRKFTRNLRSAGECSSSTWNFLPVAWSCMVLANKSCAPTSS